MPALYGYTTRSAKYVAHVLKSRDRFTSPKNEAVRKSRKRFMKVAPYFGAHPFTAEEVGVSTPGGTHYFHAGVPLILIRPKRCGV